jgi:hypothetical protein
MPQSCVKTITWESWTAKRIAWRGRAMLENEHICCSWTINLCDDSLRFVKCIHDSNLQCQDSGAAGNFLSWPCVSRSGTSTRQEPTRRAKHWGLTPRWSPPRRIIASLAFRPTRRLPSRSHGRDRRVVMVVHCWFASISEFYLETNCLLKKTLRQNTVTTDQNMHVKKNAGVFQSSEVLMWKTETLMWQPGMLMWNTASFMWNMWNMWNTESFMWNTESLMWNAASLMWNTESFMWNAESFMWNAESEKMFNSPTTSCRSVRLSSYPEISIVCIHGQRSRDHLSLASCDRLRVPSQRSQIRKKTTLGVIVGVVAGSLKMAVGRLSRDSFKEQCSLCLMMIHSSSPPKLANVWCPKAGRLILDSSVTNNWIFSCQREPRDQ